MNSALAKLGFLLGVEFRFDECHILKHMKIIYIGRNYIEHAKEINNVVPEGPVVFMKPQ